jgi:hypothetical protein
MEFHNPEKQQDLVFLLVQVGMQEKSSSCLHILGNDRATAKTKKINPGQTLGKYEVDIYWVVSSNIRFGLLVGFCFIFV